ncbi:MAG: membrane-bound O-acyltransferase family protein [Planctomycetes bacterium]|nr:membrane-bound O-acyltransferase family protein [Planctomycetota bacterium]
MVFSEYTFLFHFLPVFLAVYFATPARFRTIPLVIASYAFYGWVRYDFCLIMLASTVLDWAVSRRLEVTTGGRARRLLVACSVAGNLGLLAWFKYKNFGIDSWNTVATSLDLPEITVGQLILPVGISFYTFQSLSYTIDVYRRTVPAERSFLTFAAYVSLFPQLVAGPIVRYREIRESLAAPGPDTALFARGVFRFGLGLAKKVLIADSVGRFADHLFDGPFAGTGAIDAWTGVVAYSVQIYFDFSGYSDMAIGLGAMLGFRLPENFDSPYRSASVTEFWRRWHMTLSSWLRDYLYIPLGGNRRGRARTWVNLAVTMLLCGLWHGAQWTFVAWGAWHGALLLVERAGLVGDLDRFRPVRRFGTLLCVTLGWVVFRAADFDVAGRIFRSLFFLDGLGTFTLALWWSPLPGLIALSAGVLLAVWSPNTAVFERRITTPRAACAIALFWLACLTVLFQDYSPFLYFQF